MRKWMKIHGSMKNTLSYHRAEVILCDPSLKWLRTCHEYILNVPFVCVWMVVKCCARALVSSGVVQELMTMRPTKRGFSSLSFPLDREFVFLYCIYLSCTIHNIYTLGPMCDLETTYWWELSKTKTNTYATTCNSLFWKQNQYAHKQSGRPLGSLWPPRFWLTLLTLLHRLVPIRLMNYKCTLLL